ncbi:unnamed protein product [Dicrocoelium dendriticum]|nr:unnamed protein product [Dicrocoelium dendriticum]
MSCNDHKYEVITRNLQEVVGDEELRALLGRDDPVAVYWGTATTGRPHVAYFVPVLKLADMLHAGCKVIILFADLHAYLDNMKAPWSLLRHRTRYYEAVIKGMLKSINVPLDRLNFIRGADYELTEPYSTDLYRLLSVTSAHDARKAGAEVVKQVSNPLVSGLLYPLLQALDEIHLGVDAQFGGVDQRKIFMFAEKYLPHLGQKKRIHLMNPMVPGLTGSKMSSSDADSKVDLLDPPDLVEQKLLNAACPLNMSAEQGNGVLAFVKYVVFPLLSSQGLSIPDEDRVYKDYPHFEADFLSGRLTSDAVKRVVISCLNGRLDVIRADFEDSALQTLMQLAYPSSNALDPSTAGDAFPINMEDVASGVPRRLAELERSIPPVRDLSTLLSTFEDEFPGYRAAVSSRLSHATHVRCMWSVTPSGLIHLGHSIPLRKLARLSQLDGVHIIILVNNIAAHLRGTSPWDLVQPRGEFCRVVVTAMFNALGGRSAQMTCLLGTDFQLAGDYMLDFYRLVSLVPESDCIAASDSSGIDAAADANGAPVESKLGTQAGAGRVSLGQLILPCNDLVDTIYLGAHVRVASQERSQKRRVFEQRFISMLTTCPATVHLSHPLLPSLQVDTNAPGGGEPDGPKSQPFFRPMRTCPPASRCQGPAATLALANLAEDCTLPVVEPPLPGMEKTALASLKRRLKRAFCQPGNVSINPVLEVYRSVILPQLPIDSPLIIPRSEKNGGPLYIESPNGVADAASRWEALQAAFEQEILHPADLKLAVESLLSSGTTDLIRRLSHTLPPWDQLMTLLDAAFPIPTGAGSAKQKSKARGDASHRPREAENKVTTNGPLPNSLSATKNSVDLDPNRLDIRVGRILSAVKHPDADSLYVERVDFGPEFGQRTVVSGLSGLYPLEWLQGRRSVFIVNLKPIRMRGVESQAMLLCASHESTPPNGPRLIRPLEVPSNAATPLGTRLVFHSRTSDSHIVDPDPVINPKTHLWERLQPDLNVSPDDRRIRWKDWPLGDKSATHWAHASEDLPSGASVS